MEDELNDRIIITELWKIRFKDHRAFFGCFLSPKSLRIYQDISINKKPHNIISLWIRKGIWGGYRTPWRAVGCQGTSRRAARPFPGKLLHPCHAQLGRNPNKIYLWLPSPSFPARHSSLPNPTSFSPFNTWSILLQIPIFGVTF